MSQTPSPAPILFPRYRIFATAPDGEKVLCFNWTWAPQTGVDLAQRLAREFGQELTNFRAEAVS